ncbi:peptide chain release factor N(5)-glutamine methyltransferase [Mucilaginibacter polytrichastri]|uniref:Release factor glutamine methyltransferase n=1 Tax=Mucilaginibacter polytrichastri TaxID=1302689 RepID=A0A1Q5ZXE6_9SPHI|nr:peptide chain release factor N(5)-glutamine methyltransferase [Mucilaginibacter polytrichastri]OKS86430.1 Release factor glutamine methyltransferase [Mucilaginibacter polytrichastri]SFS77873.1 release factor glutamine methyltransferase [Mucilaginibacter polytrichastri]
MKTVQDAFNTFKQTLAPIYDAHEAEAITALVLSELTGYSKAKLKAFPETMLTDEQADKLTLILDQLKAGQPVQYILGHTEFYGLTFEVNPDVLIPRPETEELVSWIIESVENPAINILDIGTGSGCIAITLKHELKTATVSAIDISTGALETAKKNAANNQVDIQFIQADILAHANIRVDEKLDIIVSNPPYVTETDKLQMHINVTNFEPHTALFVPEKDPLLFYNAIADFAIKSLKSNGLLFFEINESYGKQTINMLKDKLFINIELKKDMSDRDRMIKCGLGGY